MIKYSSRLILIHLFPLQKFSVGKYAYQPGCTAALQDGRAPYKKTSVTVTKIGWSLCLPAYGPELLISTACKHPMVATVHASKNFPCYSSPSAITLEEHSHFKHGVAAEVTRCWTRSRVIAQLENSENLGINCSSAPFSSDIICTQVFSQLSILPQPQKKKIIIHRWLRLAKSKWTGRLQIASWD